jgi:hypothetical protein
MPIRLNLLAEARALEEERRRDPVKRALWVAGGIAVLMGLVAAYLQLQIYLAKAQVSSQSNQLSALTQKFDALKLKQDQLVVIQEKFAALDRLHTNRFLWANVLNALPQCSVRDIQVTALHCDTTLKLVELPPKPGAKITKVTKPEVQSVMRLGVQIDAKDYGPNPGDQVTKYKQAIYSNAYFHAALGATNEITLRSLSAPTVDSVSGKGVVMFSFDCKFPDKIAK